MLDPSLLDPCPIVLLVINYIKIAEFLQSVGAFTNMCYNKLVLKTFYEAKVKQGETKCKAAHNLFATVISTAVASTDLVKPVFRTCTL